MNSLKLSDINVGDIVYCLETVYYQGMVGGDLDKYTIISIDEQYIGMNRFGDTSGEIYSSSFHEDGTFTSIIGMYYNIDDAHTNAIEYNETKNPALSSVLRIEHEKIKKMRILRAKI